jgi:hypothetical protein
MGVKQLQVYLADAGVAHANCVEKADLQKKATYVARTTSIKERLYLFYKKFNPGKIGDAAKIAEQVKGDEVMLNDLLRNAYEGKDLSCVAPEQEAKSSDARACASPMKQACSQAQQGNGITDITANADAQDASIHSSLKENSGADRGSGSGIPASSSPQPLATKSATPPTVAQGVGEASLNSADVYSTAEQFRSSGREEAKQVKQAAPASPPPKPPKRAPAPAPAPAPALAPVLVPIPQTPIELMRSWLQQLGVPVDKSQEYAETLCEQGFEEPAELIEAEMDAAALSGEPFKFMYKYANKVAKECSNPQLASSSGSNRAMGGAGASTSDSHEVLQLKRRLQEAEAAAAEAKALAPPSPRGRAGSEWVLAGWELPSKEIQKLRPLGRGSFGEVMLVRVRGVQMASKSLTSVSGGGHASAVQALLKELRPMAELLHKHIVRLWGACTEPGELCILMEYMERGSLREVLDAHPNLPPPLRFRLLHGIILGMTHAHAHKPCPVLHRDLKSANILVGADWRSVVGDLGLATGAGATLSKTHTAAGVAGTLAYSAPEVLNDKKWTTAGDVYSFGVLAFEVITGKIPFLGFTVVELVMAVVAKAQRCHNRGDDQPLESTDLDTGEALTGCDTVMGQAMLAAWGQQPESRPSFEDLRGMFERAEDGVGGGTNSVCAAELADAAGAADPAAPRVVAVAPRAPAAVVEVGRGVGGGVGAAGGGVAAGGGGGNGDPKFAPYHKMRKMRLPDGAIRQKMMSNGESDADIALFFGGGAGTTGAAAGGGGGGGGGAPATPAAAPTVDNGGAGGGGDPKFAPYHKMRKMRLPDGAIRQKMMSNGESDADIALFFGGGAGTTGAGVLAPRAALPARPAMGGAGGGGGKIDLMAAIKAKKGSGLKKAKPMEPKKVVAGGGGGGGMMAMIAAGVKLKKADRSARPAPKPAPSSGGGFAAELQRAIKKPQLRQATTDLPSKSAERRPSGGSNPGGLFSAAVQARIDMQRKAIHDTCDDIHDTHDWDPDA